MKDSCSILSPIQFRTEIEFVGDNSITPEYSISSGQNFESENDEITIYIGKNQGVSHLIPGAKTLISSRKKRFDLTSRS